MAAPPTPTDCVSLWWAGDPLLAGSGSANWRIGLSWGGNGPTTPDDTAVGSWVDSVGSFDAANTDTTSQPRFRRSDVGGKPSVQFNWTTTPDQLSVASAVNTGDAAGSVIAVIQMDSPQDLEAIWAARDTASSNKYLIGTMRTVTGSTARIAVYQQNTSGTGAATDVVRGTTTFSTNTPVLLEWSSNGSAYDLRLNNASETLVADSGANTGDWFDNIGSYDTFRLGWFATSGTGGFKGHLSFLAITSSVLSSGDRSSIYSWAQSEYGVA